MSDAGFSIHVKQLEMELERRNRPVAVWRDWNDDPGRLRSSVNFGALPPPLSPAIKQRASEMLERWGCSRHAGREAIAEQDAGGRVRFWCVECWIDYIWPQRGWRRALGRVFRRRQTHNHVPTANPGTGGVFPRSLPSGPAPPPPTAPKGGTGESGYTTILTRR